MSRLHIIDIFRKQKAGSLQDGARIHLFGQEVLLRVIRTQDQETVQYRANVFTVYTKRFYHHRIRALLEQWFRKTARQYLQERLDFHSQRLSIPYKRLSIRGQKTRWGSASSLKNVSLNWKLLQLSPGMIDYVIVHELTHLLEMNHSKIFWNHMDRHFPDHRIVRKQLRQREKQLIFR